MRSLIIFAPNRFKKQNMKKIFLILTCLFMCLGLFAQKKKAKKDTIMMSQSRFGIRAALDASTLTGIGTSGTGSVTGLNAGVFYEIALSPTFSIQPELAYSQKGGKQSISGVIGFLTNTNNNTIYQSLNYVTLPILFKFKPQGDNGFNFFIGPEFGYLIKATNVQYFATYVKRFDLKPDLRNFDGGLVIGGGYDFLKHFGVDMRYTFGLGNVANNAVVTNYNNVTSAGPGSIHNDTFQLGIRYGF